MLHVLCDHLCACIPMCFMHVSPGMHAACPRSEEMWLVRACGDCWLGDEVLPSSGRLISPQEMLMCDSLTKGLQSSQVVGGLQDSRLQGEFSILLQLLVFSCQSWEAP